MSIPPEMLQQLLAGAMEEPDAPQVASPERMNALRRQQALGVLGQMGGANVGQFGQAMQRGARQEMADVQAQQQAAQAQQGQGLDRALKAMQVAQKAQELSRDPMAGKAQWDIKPDPVTGGFLRVNKYTGEVQPVKGYGPGAKADAPFDPEAPPTFGKMNEVQSKAQLYAMNAAPALGGLRYRMADDWRPSMAAKGLYESGGIGMTGTALGYLASPEDLSYIRDAKDLIAAILRKESGAAITESEWASGAQRFIPMPWDDSKTVDQKLKGAERAIKNIAAGAGPAAKYSRKYIDYFNNPENVARERGLIEDSGALPQTTGRQRGAGTKSDPIKLD